MSSSTWEPQTCQTVVGKGPFVTSLRRNAVVSPTQNMERGEAHNPSVGAHAQQAAQMPTGGSEQVLVTGSRRTPGSAAPCHIAL